VSSVRNSESLVASPTGAQDMSSTACSSESVRNDARGEAYTPLLLRGDRDTYQYGASVDDPVADLRTRVLNTSHVPSRSASPVLGIALYIFYSSITALVTICLTM